MRKTLYLCLALVIAVTTSLTAQTQQEVVDAIVKEATENSQLEKLAYKLTDFIGPRLVGTPQMQHAHDWAVEQFNEWGIEAENQQYGEWDGWVRGITHIDMVSPRVVSLNGQQLAWSPATGPEGITAELEILPMVENQAEFDAWLESIDGKIILVSQPQITGRPDYNWEEFATEESFERMKEKRSELTREWQENLRNIGYGRELNQKLEEAGAVAIFQSYWSQGFGANKIFGANTKTAPVVDLSLEDYGMLYRMVQNGDIPEVYLRTESEDLGKVPTFNTIATIPGGEKADEYIVLSAHYDSWDGGTGATDNATGSITMLEAARILKKVYPNPKRTIVVGLWGGEEQGLNGSAAFVEDNPEIAANLQALFNQDNGTGRVVNINGQGFLHSYEFLQRWLAAVPGEYRNHIQTTFPGTPSSGGSDHASFIAAGAPAFFLSALNWSYYNYTWHTNIDTYDKIVFDDVRNNAILTAILAYMASEDPESFPRDRAVLPLNPRTGEQMNWPGPRTPNRTGNN
ncbi:MAG TPA: M20/M25/M40 family metallo-hydrolase [Balneolaceae bacterium]|nr:M20/M25/M40 family metallo-hydrolase [Balneolaceae bacterium]